MIFLYVCHLYKSGIERSWWQIWCRGRFAAYLCSVGSRCSVNSLWD